MMVDGRHPTAMVSWVHADHRWSAEQIAAWREDVLAFGTALLANGVGAELDLWHYHESNVDWTRWGPNQVEASDFTLIAITDAWRERWQGHNSPDEGAGVVAETDTLRGLFRCDQARFQRRTVIVLLPGVPAAAIPADLQRLVRVRIPEISAVSVRPLVRLLLNQPFYPKPPIGRTPDLGLGGHPEIT
jgi:hypothetical protein